MVTFYSYSHSTINATIFNELLKWHFINNTIIRSFIVIVDQYFGDTFFSYSYPTKY